MSGALFLRVASEAGIKTAAAQRSSHSTHAGTTSANCWLKAAHGVRVRSLGVARIVRCFSKVPESRFLLHLCIAWLRVSLPPSDIHFFSDNCSLHQRCVSNQRGVV